MCRSRLRTWRQGIAQTGTLPGDVRHRQGCAAYPASNVLGPAASGGLQGMCTHKHTRCVDGPRFVEGCSSCSCCSHQRTWRMLCSQLPNSVGATHHSTSPCED